MPVRVADLLGEGHRVIGGGQPRQALRPERLVVVDGVLGQLAQPLVFGLVVVALDAQALGQGRADVEIVPALADRRDRLLHEDRVVAGARPRGVDVVALPEGGGGQQDVGVARGRRDEVILDHHEVEPLHALDDPAHVGELVEEIARAGVDHLHVGRVAARLPALQQIGQERRGHPRAHRVLAGGERLDSAAPGGAIAGARVAARDAHIAGHRAERVGRAVELLAVERAPGRVTGLERGGLGGGVLDRESPQGLGGHAGDRGRPLRRLGHAVGLAEEIGAVRGARGRAGGQVRLVEAQHVAVEIGLIVPPLGEDHVGHRDQRGGVGRGPDEHVLVRELPARAGAPRVHADDLHAALLGELQVLQRAGAEGAVGRAPAPHDDQARVHVVGRLAARALVVGLGPVGLAHREDLGLRRDVRPQLGAAAEHVEQALDRGPAVQHRQAAGARAVEDGRRPVRLADAEHLARDLVEGLVPADPLELPGATRADPSHRVDQPVGMIQALELAEAAHAGVERGFLRGPLARIGADLDDAPVAHVGVDHAAAAAIVSAGAGDHGLARRGGRPGRFVTDGLGHGDSRELTAGRAERPVC